VASSWRLLQLGNFGNWHPELEEIIGVKETVDKIVTVIQALSIASVFSIAFFNFSGVAVTQLRPCLTTSCRD